MKLYSRFLFLLLLTSSVNAKNYKDYKGEVLAKPYPCPVVVLKDGIYMGASAGYDFYNVRQDISVPDINGSLDQGNPRINARGWVGALFAGYGRYFDWFYIAGEISANYSGAQSSYSITNYHTNFNVRETYSASILPGIALGKTILLYTRFGYVRSFFSASEDMRTAFDLNTTSWGNGLLYGLGVEGVVYKNVSLRGEYSYASYTTFKSPINTSFMPADNQVTLGMIYHFDYL